MISVDRFTRIAHGKSVCQDYATVRDTDSGDAAWGIVADGCSTGIQTEVGAMLLAESLRTLLYPGCRVEDAYQAALGKADGISAALDLDPSALNATLLVAGYHNRCLTTAMAGDGFRVCRRRRDASYDIVRYAYTENLPAYPAYRLRNFAQYQRTSDDRQNRRKVTWWNMTPDGVVERWQEDEWDVSLRDDSVCMVQILSPASYDLVLVFTDGLESFCKDNVPVPIEEVFPVFLAFKGLHGVFLQRCMNVAWRRCAELGWKNHDDFGAAGVSVVD